MKERLENTKETLHARVHGTVQGVGFRYSTVSKARQFGLTGYARNLSDGSVEVVAEGRKTDLKNLLSWLRLGPPSARVVRVNHRYLPHSGSYRSFGIEF